MEHNMHAAWVPNIIWNLESFLFSPFSENIIPPVAPENLFRPHVHTCSRTRNWTRHLYLPAKVSAHQVQTPFSLQCQLLLIEREYIYANEAHNAYRRAAPTWGLGCEQKHYYTYTCIGSWFRLSGPQRVCVKCELQTCTRGREWILPSVLAHWELASA